MISYKELGLVNTKEMFAKANGLLVGCGSTMTQMQSAIGSPLSV